MMRCPKCNEQVPGTQKICRACGGILEEVPEEHVQAAKVQDSNSILSEPVNSENENETLDCEPAGPEWKCTKCGETVPGNFDACWKCMTTKTGEANPDAEELLSEVDKDKQGAEPTEMHSEFEKNEGDFWLPKCRGCGSHQIIRKAAVVTSESKLTAVVMGNPDAMLFKDPLHREIQADICGECGLMDFRVSNPQELYEHFLKSVNNGASPCMPEEFSSKPCAQCGMLVVVGSPACPHCGSSGYDD